MDSDECAGHPLSQHGDFWFGDGEFQLQDGRAGVQGFCAEDVIRALHALCTNAFQKLDYGEGYGEQEGECSRRWYRKMAETDHGRQLKLVFGDGAVPANFLSHTDSHAFDGCHAELVYRRILVYDLDVGVLYGYAWHNWL